MAAQNHTKIIEQLQSDILRLQGFKTSSDKGVNTGIGPFAEAFPQGTFPTGAIHEFLTSSKEDIAATTGFMAGILATLMGENGVVVWIGSSRTLFPPALRNFNIQPDRFVFVDLKEEKKSLWVVEEALKCNAITAVAAEMKFLDFTASRRLQLAVEKSNVTGFVIRPQLQKPNITACVSRWKISTLPSQPIEDLPGIGYPRWKVEILRMRNGRTGVWELGWMNGSFVQADQVNIEKDMLKIHVDLGSQRKTG